ncbi:MAG TPA: hypothetical protein VGX21_07065 [Methylomirabilota bacterium]|nr:hypothetical protein [Methylomirabilota bacterium]
MKTLGRPTPWLRWAGQGVATLTTLLGLVTLGWAHGGDPTLIHGCVQQGSSHVRIVGPFDVCRRTETAVDWPAGGAVGPAATPSGSLQVVDADGSPVGPVVSLQGLNAVVAFKAGGQIVALQLIGDQLLGYDAVWFGGAGCTGQAYVQSSESALRMTAIDNLGRVYVDDGSSVPAMVTIGSYAFPNDTNTCFPGGFPLLVVPAALVADLESTFTAPFRVE